MDDMRQIIDNVNSVTYVFIAGLIIIVIMIGFIKLLSIFSRKNKTIRCPFCSTLLNLGSNQNMTLGCPNCNKFFIMRKHKIYKEEAVCNEFTYYIIIILANIARFNKKAMAEYDNFFELYVRKQNINKTQYEDMVRIYEKEKNRLMFGSTYKRVIKQLSRFLYISYEKSSLQEQEKQENDIFVLLYSFANLSKINEKQRKILRYYMKKFNINEKNFRVRGI
jgi:phage FluMu protein Com